MRSGPLSLAPGPSAINPVRRHLGAGCRGSKLLRTQASGSPAFAQYKIDPAGGHAPWALQVLEISGDHISGIHSFLDAERLFKAFGLPDHLPA